MTEAEVREVMKDLNNYMKFASHTLNNYGYFVSYNVDMGRVEIHERSVFGGTVFIDSLEIDISEAGVYAAKCFISGFKSGINSMADRMTM